MTVKYQTSKSKRQKLKPDLTPSDLGPDIRFSNGTLTFDDRAKFARSKNPCPTILHLMAARNQITEEELAAGLKFNALWAASVREARVVASFDSMPPGGALNETERGIKARQDLNWVLSRLPPPARDPVITVAGLNSPLGEGRRDQKLLRTGLGTLYGLFVARNDDWVNDILEGAR